MPSWGHEAMGLITGIALGAMAIGQAINARGQIKAGNAAKAAGKSQQDVAELQAQQLETNATSADAQAKDAIDRGQVEESKFRTGVRSLVGSQRTGFAGQGIKL